jgi:hypothetical protein
MRRVDTSTRKTEILVEHTACANALPGSLLTSRNLLMRCLLAIHDSLNPAIFLLYY